MALWERQPPHTHHYCFLSLSSSSSSSSSFSSSLNCWCNTTTTTATICYMCHDLLHVPGYDVQLLPMEEMTLFEQISALRACTVCTWDDRTVVHVPACKCQRYMWVLDDVTARNVHCTCVCPSCVLSRNYTFSLSIMPLSPFSFLLSFHLPFPRCWWGSTAAVSTTPFYCPKAVY